MANVIRTVEEDIVRRVILALIGAGLKVSVWYDSDTVGEVVKSDDVDAIMEDAFAVDECLLRTKEGSVFLVFGNSGWDVINDYSGGLEDILTPVEDYIAATYDS